MEQKQKELRKEMQNFEKSEMKKSIWQLINTMIPFFLCWYFAYISLSVSYFLSIPFILIATGLVVRIFIIFHDCCHNSFFRNKKVNKIIGTITGIITMFPFSQWQHSHNIHHGASGNLDKRGIGDLWVMTVQEYQKAGRIEKVKYRLYRNPFVMFVLGPIYTFLIQQRFNKKGAKKGEKINTYVTNLSLVLIYGLLIWFIGWKPLLLIQGPIFLLSGSMGIWLFYVQHQFEDTYFEWQKDWDFVKAAVEGSSYYKLPKILQWITGNIGFHHVHHLSPKIPNYNLEKAHNHSEPLKNVPTVTLWTSLKSFKLHLWDDKNKKFIGFKEIEKKTY